jgi:acyl-homoserine-lactone acylase
LAALACLTASLLVPAAANAANATIKRTAHGIPHITASTWDGLGFGYGYALAQDNICVVADSYVTVRAERSRHFGPDGRVQFRGNGSNASNLNSDFFYQRIIDSGVVEKLRDTPPPNGPRGAIKSAVSGYVRGYNKYLSDVGVNNLSDPNCRGADWVKPLHTIDAYRRFYQLGLLASQGVAVDGIAEAQPLVGGASAATASEPDRDQIQELGRRLPMGGLGSNAYGLGSSATADGKGMVLGNPHFPWDGSERFYQAQLRIPGKINVSGASLYGVPVVLIGHNKDLAWSHTVSTAYRFTPFEEKLVPGSPTTYLKDGQPKEMKAETVTVKVKTDSGFEDRTRTLYSTDHGPIFTSILGLPLFPWTPATAYAMGDANADNFRYLNHFFETDQASTTDELHEILKRNQGIPWVNTIASDSRGKAFYADISVVPHVTDEKAQTCNSALGVVTFQLLRLPVLDGSRGACDWGSDPDAVKPGIFGPSNLPHLFRDDYVTNSNDSYWLSNPEQPLEGFNRIIGDERTARSLRTRLGLRIVQQRLDGSDGQAGNRFTVPLLRDAVFNNRQYAGELWRDQLVQMCNANPTVITRSGPVDVREACPVLASWDLHDDLDSPGAILFRRFAGRALNSLGLPVGGVPSPYSTPFDAGDPVNTPRGLDTNSPFVKESLGLAVKDLRDSGIPLDSKLRDFQFERRGDEKIPIHGGPGTVGVFNAINVPFVQGQGYPDVPHGSSFVMVSRLTGGCPDTRTILTYSLSTNPASPYFADQTRMFSNKEWVNERFCQDQIAADPALKVKHIGD